MNIQDGASMSPAVTIIHRSVWRIQGWYDYGQ